MKKKYRLKKKNLFLIIVFLGSIFLMVRSGFKIVCWFIDNKKSEVIIENLEQKVTFVQDEESGLVIQNEEEIAEDDPYWDFIKLNLVDVDLSKLKEENKDTIGWLSVLGTNINYPFVQTNDNKFYLTHDFKKNYNGGGWVFLDYRNSKDISDKNNIIYAHGRANNTMFGSLKNILSNDWIQNESNFVVQISTESKNTLWQVFSVYRIKNTNDYIQTSFNDDEEFASFIDMLLKRSKFDFKTKVNKDDKVLTLSTCYNDYEKVVLHAKLIKSN